MVRIIGVNIADNQRIEYALTAIYGMGFARANLVLKAAGIETHTRVKDLADGDIKKIQDIIEKSYKVEGDLKEEVNINIKRLKEIGAYRGLRHIKALPSRGQRTRSNARTKRGKRKTIGAMKKEDLARIQQSAQKK